MTAILLANLVPLRVVVGIVLVQTLAVVALLWTTISGDGMAYAVSTGVAFFAFQLFALLMVVSVRATEAARTEADRARGEAEAANAALRAAQTQLATTSRTQERLRDRKSTRLNSSHRPLSRMPSSA